jgi:hypothetical protein
VDASMERSSMPALGHSTCYVRETLHAGIETFYMHAWTEIRLLLQGYLPVDMGSSGVYGGWLSISIESRRIEHGKFSLINIFSHRIHAHAKK